MLTIPSVIFYIIIYIIGCIITYIWVYNAFGLKDTNDIKDPITFMIVIPWVILGYIATAIISLGSWISVLVIIIFEITYKIEKK